MIGGRHGDLQCIAGRLRLEAQPLCLLALAAHTNGSVRGRSEILIVSINDDPRSRHGVVREMCVTSSRGNARVKAGVSSEGVGNSYTSLAGASLSRGSCFAARMVIKYLLSLTGAVCTIFAVGVHEAN